MPTFDNVLVTGNQTIQQHLQVNGNTTLQGSVQVNTNQTVANHLSVGGSASVGENLNVTGVAIAGEQVKVTNQAVLPAGVPTVQAVRYFATGVANQPGLVLKGTDGFDYVLFIDNTGGNANIAIQRLT